MIKLRVMTTAYLINDGDFLLMKRAMNRNFAPDIWAGVGGHLEHCETNDPQRACIREIYEETALRQEDIKNLNLKYIIIRRSKDEIRIQYVYFATTSTREFINTYEGELFWIGTDEILARKLSATTRFTLKHYLTYGDQTNDILVGTVNTENRQPVMNWCTLQDWES